MSVELVQFVSVVESYVYSNIYMLSLLKINRVDSERTFLFLLCLHTCSTKKQYVLNSICTTLPTKHVLYKEFGM